MNCTSLFCIIDYAYHGLSVLLAIITAKILGVFIILRDLDKTDAAVSIFSSFSSIVAAGAVIFTAYIGGKQINKWQDEKRFDIRIKNALKIMKITYRARRSLFLIRYNIPTDNELEKAKDKLKNEGVEISIIDSREDIIKSVVFLNRIKERTKEKNAILKCLPVAQSTFGDDIKDALEDLAHNYVYLRNIANNVVSSASKEEASEYLNLLYIDRTKMKVEDNTESTIGERIREAESLDSLEKKISNHVKLIEKRCLPILKNIEII